LWGGLEGKEKTCGGGVGNQAEIPGKLKLTKCMVTWGEDGIY